MDGRASRKALDLLRDPRLVVHSPTSDRAGTEGDFKLYGRAVDVPDPKRRHRFRGCGRGQDQLAASGTVSPLRCGHHKRRVRDLRTGSVWAAVERGPRRGAVGDSHVVLPDSQRFNDQLLRGNHLPEKF